MFSMEAESQRSERIEKLKAKGECFKFFNSAFLESASGQAAANP